MIYNIGQYIWHIKWLFIGSFEWSWDFPWQFARGCMAQLDIDVIANEERTVYFNIVIFFSYFESLLINTCRLFSFFSLRYIRLSASHVFYYGILHLPYCFYCYTYPLEEVIFWLWNPHIKVFKTNEKRIWKKQSHYSVG